jgi:hypothetical protein
MNKDGRRSSNRKRFIRRIQLAKFEVGSRSYVDAKMAPLRRRSAGGRAISGWPLQNDAEVAGVMAFRLVVAG